MRTGTVGRQRSLWQNIRAEAAIYQSATMSRYSSACESEHQDERPGFVLVFVQTVGSDALIPHKLVSSGPSELFFEARSVEV